MQTHTQKEGGDAQREGGDAQREGGDVQLCMHSLHFHTNICNSVYVIVPTSVLVFIFSVGIYMILDDIKTSRIKQQVEKIIPQICELSFIFFTVYFFSHPITSQYNFGKLCSIVYTHGLCS